MNLASFCLLLLLCSKFYFLWGFDVWPKPTAPIAIVALRDVICWGTLGVFAWQGRNHFLKRDLKFFSSLLGLGLLISCFHLAESKSIFDWVQHYLRNTLLPLLFYPVGLAFFRSGRKLEITQVLLVSTVVNVGLGVAQLFFFPKLMWGEVRPTGIIGDPLIMSLLILFGAFAAFSLRLWISLIISLSVFYILVFASSVSALVSFGAGLAATGFLIVRSGRLSLMKFLKVAAFSGLGLIVLFSVALLISSQIGNQKDLLLPKITALAQSALCTGDQCEKHWSYQGRILSNQLAVDLCQADWRECLVGQYSKPNLLKVDSTLASLTLNWGLVFTLMVVVWIFLHIKTLWTASAGAQVRSFDLSMWSLIFFSCLAFSFFNAVIYKYPINILLYLSMAFIKNLETEKS